MLKQNQAEPRCGPLRQTSRSCNPPSTSDVGERHSAGLITTGQDTAKSTVIIQQEFAAASRTEARSGPNRQSAIHRGGWRVGIYAAFIGSTYSEINPKTVDSLAINNHGSPHESTLLSDDRAR